MEGEESVRHDQIDAAAVKRTRRARAIAEAADRLQREVDRQDAARYRDWNALVEAIVDAGCYSLSDLAR